MWKKEIVCLALLLVLCGTALVTAEEIEYPAAEAALFLENESGDGEKTENNLKDGDLLLQDGLTQLPVSEIAADGAQIVPDDGTEEEEKSDTSADKLGDSDAEHDADTVGDGAVQEAQDGDTAEDSADNPEGSAEPEDEDTVPADNPEGSAEPEDGDADPAEAEDGETGTEDELPLDPGGVSFPDIGEPDWLNSEREWYNYVRQTRIKSDWRANIMPIAERAAEIPGISKFSREWNAYFILFVIHAGDGPESWADNDNLIPFSGKIRDEWLPKVMEDGLLSRSVEDIQRGDILLLNTVPMRAALVYGVKDNRIFVYEGASDGTVKDRMYWKHAEPYPYGYIPLSGERRKPQEKKENVQEKPEEEETASSEDAEEIEEQETAQPEGAEGEETDEETPAEEKNAEGEETGEDTEAGEKLTENDAETESTGEKTSDDEADTGEENAEDGEETESAEEEPSDEGTANEQPTIEQTNPQRNAQIVFEADGEVKLGTTVTLRAKLEGYDGLNCAICWQVDRGEGWTDAGTEGETISFVLDGDNWNWLWRIQVKATRQEDVRGESDE